MRRGLRLFALAMLLVVTGVAVTQSPEREDPPKDKKGLGLNGPDSLSRAIHDLDLTDAQRAKVEQIQKAHEEKNRELFKKLFDEHKKIDRDTLKALKEVLTDKQLGQVEEALKKGPPPDDKKGPPDRKGPPAKGKDQAKNAPPPAEKIGRNVEGKVLKAADRIMQRVGAEIEAALRQAMKECED